MKIYVLTEAERDALLKELELEKFKKSQFNLPGTTEDQMLENCWRKFHYIICNALK